MKGALGRVFLLVCSVGIAGCASGTQEGQAQAHAFVDDRVTQLRIEQALQRRASNTLNQVQVTVTNGIAYLSGSVANAEQRALAARVAHGIHRVKGVQNALEVRGSTQGENHTPAE